MPLLGTFGASSSKGFGQGLGGPINLIPFGYLIVAGGGSGGGNYGGGGGGGGMRQFSIPEGQQEVKSGTYTITVGAGGAGAAPAYPGDGADGNDSSVFTGSTFEVTSTGGGGGGNQDPGLGVVGRTGGAGGGGGPAVTHPIIQMKVQETREVIVHLKSSWRFNPC